MKPDYSRYEDFESVFPRRLKRIYNTHEEPTNIWETIPENLCTVCLDVRMSFNGSSDPWSMSSIIKTRDMLKRRLDNWYPSKDVIDECVKKMVEETVRLCDEQLALGEKGCFCFWDES